MNFLLLFLSVASCSQLIPDSSERKEERDTIPLQKVSNTFIPSYESRKRTVSCSFSSDDVDLYGALELFCNPELASSRNQSIESDTTDNEMWEGFTYSDETRHNSLDYSLNTSEIKRPADESIKKKSGSRSRSLPQKFKSPLSSHSEDECSDFL